MLLSKIYGKNIIKFNHFGVIVKRIVKDQIADICGFKIFDTILFTNNIPCTSHKQTISIIDQNAIASKK